MLFFVLNHDSFCKHLNQTDREALVESLFTITDVSVCVSKPLVKNGCLRGEGNILFSELEIEKIFSHEFKFSPGI